MRLEELVKVTSSEEKAEEFLREKGILKTFTRCPKCGSKRLGRVRRNFYKCYNCKREFSVRSGSILEGTRISFRKFVLLVKLFILEVPVNRAYKELGLSCNTEKIWMRRFTKRWWNLLSNHL